MAVQLNDLYASTLVRGQKQYTDYEYKYFDARTNLQPYSENFSNWAVSYINVTDNVALAPDGENTAGKLLCSAGSGVHDIYYSLTTTIGQQYTRSYFVKYGNHQFVQLAVVNQPGEYANFDLINNKVNTYGNCTATLEKTGQEYYRLTFTFTATAVNSLPLIGIVPAIDSARRPTWTAAGIEYIYIWGGQSETGAEATWYIPTTSTTVTKPAGVYSRLNPLAFKRTALWGASTNKVTCRKANPTDTSNVTKAGDAAAVLSVVDDAAALAAAGLDKVCTSGKVYKLDNSGGSSLAYAYSSGDTGNTNNHSLSAYIRGSGTGKFGSTEISKVVTLTSTYSREVYENQTITATNRKFYVGAEAGAIVYFILPQLEESPYCTPPIFQDSNGDDPLTSLTRPATLCEADSAGVLRGNNLALMGQVIPGASGQNVVRVFGTHVTDNNYSDIYPTLTQLVLRKYIDSTTYAATIAFTHTKNVSFQYQAYLSSSYGMGIRARYWLGMAWSAWTEWATNADTQDAPIAPTFEIGSRNDANRFVGNYQMFLPYWTNDPKTYLENLEIAQ